MNVKILALLRDLIIASDENRVEWVSTSDGYSVNARGVDVTISKKDDYMGIFGFMMKFKEHDFRMDCTYPIMHVLYTAAEQNVHCRRL